MLHRDCHELMKTNSGCRCQKQMIMDPAVVPSQPLLSWQQTLTLIVGKVCTVDLKCQRCSGAYNMQYPN